MKPPAAWAHLPFFSTNWPELRKRLEELPGWLPGPDRIFSALKATSPERARVIILGQDPYPTPGHANGLAFSVNPEVALPRSLKNIYAEMRDDLGAAPATGDLSHWAQQGVLLLNTSLSVLPGQAGAHAKWGWEQMTKQVISATQDHGSIAFLLWGGHAQKAAAGLPRPQDLTIATAHPSPLSARRGFFGSRPFSQINQWLTSQDRKPIDWVGDTLPPNQ